MNNKKYKFLLINIPIQTEICYGKIYNINNKKLIQKSILIYVHRLYSTL